MSLPRLGSHGKKVTLGLFFCIIILVIGVSSVMSNEKSLKNSYWLVFSVDNALADIRVNGVSVFKNSEAEEASESQPIAHLLTNGKNIVTFNFLAAIAKNNTLYINDYAKKDFFMAARIDVSGENGSESIDIGYIDFNNDKYESVEKSLKHVSFNPVGSNVQVKQIGQIEKSQFITYFGQKFDSFKIDYDINITNDNFRELRWRNASSININDPDVKKKIINKYNDLRQFISNNDGSSYVKEFYDGWDNTAYVYGLGSGDDFVKEVDARNPNKIGEGLQFNKFDYSEDEYTFEVSYESKLVRLLPPPIVWEGNGNTIAVQPVFYFDKDMNIHAASIVTD